MITLPGAYERIFTIAASRLLIFTPSMEVMIDPTTATDVVVRAGSSIVLTVADPAKWSAEVVTPGIVSFVPGGDQGGYITNPSLRALTSGATTVKLVNSDDPTKVYQIEITVND